MGDFSKKMNKNFDFFSRIWSQKECHIMVSFTKSKKSINVTSKQLKLLKHN